MPHLSSPTVCSKHFHAKLSNIDGKIERIWEISINKIED